MSLAPPPLFITLTGTLAADVIAQADTIAAGTARDITIDYLGLAGEDTLTAYSGPSDWPGFATGDLEATETLTIRNLLWGGYGNDVLIAGHNPPDLSDTQAANYLRSDTLDGWKGNDTYIVSDLNVTIQDAWGINTLILTADFAANSGLTQVSVSTFSQNTYQDIQNITLLGTADMDIFGDSQHNVFRGNDGRNLIFSNDGDDRSYGGGGDDTIWGVGDVWEHGGDGADTVRSSAGNSTLMGGAGNDLLIGNEGNDILIGGGGGDHMVGFEGDDLYVVNHLNDSIDSFAGSGFDTVASQVISLDGANYLGVERLMLTGTADLNAIGGNDVVALVGNDGANGLLGSAADETLSGGAGDDRIGGEAGNDMLTGGAGYDKLYGGSGADLFVFDNAADDAAAPDVIMDFTSGEDRIDLTALGIVQARPDGIDATGMPSVAWFAGTAQVGDLGVGDFITVTGDTNGDGTEDFRLYLANFSGTTILTAADFLLEIPV